MEQCNPLPHPVSRRSLLKTGSMLAMGTALPVTHGAHASHAANTNDGVALGPTLYESLGVKPIINCRGTFTIISGSQTLPEVKKAMDEASRHYVQMDELMEAVGQRLAELSGAEWGVVTAGCAAAITNATAACLAGTDPEKMQRLPDLTGMKTEVIIPKYSRNPYDHAVRMLGVTIVEVDSEEELVNAFSPKTAMIYILSSPSAEKGPLGIANICKIAKEKGVPVFVDAAAEEPRTPNIHLQRGATFVGYSGGKCMRGPQCAGLLLGQKAMVKAAWANSAPHHAFGRSLKVGKEEIIGMLIAFEMWGRRDHDAEWKTWMTWLGTIRDRVNAIAGVTTEYLQPEDLSNHAPQLRIHWDASQLGITGTEVVNALASGTPRIFLASGTGVRPDTMASSVTIMPYMMMPGDDRIAAEALYAIMSKPPRFTNPVVPVGETEDIAGVWDLEITYALGTAHHHLMIEQSGTALQGVHEGESLRSNLAGKVQGDHVTIISNQPIQGQVIHYVFTGVVRRDVISGEVILGEYGSAQWRASRHSYARSSTPS
jgi:L-seryl-tRNA(Ser) seleniumtransferase